VKNRVSEFCFKINLYRYTEVADKWGAMIAEEFFKQGDRERALGMRVLDFCDRTKAGPG
jgi:hypothetical protein